MKASEWKERTLLGLWWLMFGAAAMWLLVGSTAYWVRHGWLPPDTSGWVQAFGGIGAIVGVFMVSRLEATAKKNERLQDDYDYMNKALRIAGYATASIEGYYRDVEARPLSEVGLQYNIDIFETVQLDMEGIDYGRIAELDAATAWSDLRRSMRLILSNLKSKVGTAQQLSVPQAQMWHKRAQLDIDALQNAIVAFGSRHSCIRRRYE